MRIADLADVDPDADRVFGGKACGLARLLAASARVPAGFAVEAGTEPPPAWPPDALQEFHRRVAALLDGHALAVRSSAVGEDSAARSFAGMFETVLGVGRPEAAVTAAARCIASATAERVRAYAGGTSPVPVGLVVQQQVDARAAGVCFTVDPGGKGHAIVIEAVAGTGDTLVSGHATPERWRVYRTGLGGWEPRREPGPATVLRPERARTIAAEAAALADRLGRPLDLEWAEDAAGTLWWLQARPVTAAAAPPTWDIERYAEDVDDGPVTVWSNWNVRETMPDPHTPLSWSLWRELIMPMVLEDIFGVPHSSPVFRQLAGLDRINGRIYWNMNAMFAGPWGVLFRRLIAILDARAAATLLPLVDSGVLRPRRVRGSGPRLLVRTLAANLAALFRFGDALHPGRSLEQLAAGARAIAARPPLGALDDRGLFAELRLFGSPEAERFRRAHHMMALTGLIWGAADHAFKRHPEARALLTAGIAGNPTTRISIEIDALVDAARPLAAAFAEPLPTAALLARLENEPGGADWLARFRDFLAEFGQRGPKEFDVAAPRWVDDPTMIVDLVRAGLRSRGVERTTDRLARMAAARRAALDAALAQEARWKRPLLRRLAGWAERFAPLREAPKHYAMFVFLRMRHAALELGSRLAARGVLERAEDVFFLDLRELDGLTGGASAADYRPRVRDRRERFAYHQAHPAPDFLRSDGVPVIEEDTAAAADGVLRGTGVSIGSASGPIRVLRDPDPNAMADGDVIVMEFADPGWTPLFPRARAVVMEVGGLMCHAAVVARELGIPAVFGVGGATRLLKDGDTVAVDGAAGTVTYRLT